MDAEYVVFFNESIVYEDLGGARPVTREALDMGDVLDQAKEIISLGPSAFSWSLLKVTTDPRITISGIVEHAPYVPGELPVFPQLEKQAVDVASIVSPRQLEQAAIAERRILARAQKYVARYQGGASRGIQGKKA